MMLLLSAIIYLLNTEKIRAQSNQASIYRSTIFKRGGSQEQKENQELDALIEDLIQEVEDSSSVGEVVESKRDEDNFIDDIGIVASSDSGKTVVTKKKRKKKKRRAVDVDGPKRQNASDVTNLPAVHTNSSTEVYDSDKISAASKGEEQRSKSLYNEQIAEEIPPVVPPNAIYRMLLTKVRAYRHWQSCCDSFVIL